MKEKEGKSGKGWDIFLAVLSAFLGAVFSLALAPGGSAEPTKTGQSALRDFFTITTNIATPILILGLIIAGLSTLLFILKLFDIFNFFEIFTSDFWDLF